MFFTKSNIAPQYRRFMFPFSFRREHEDVLQSLVINKSEVEIIFNRFSLEEVVIEGNIKNNLGEELWVEITDPKFIRNIPAADKIMGALDNRGFWLMGKDWDGSPVELPWTSPHSHRLAGFPRYDYTEYGKSGRPH